MVVKYGLRLGSNFNRLVRVSIFASLILRGIVAPPCPVRVPFMGVKRHERLCTRMGGKALRYKRLEIHRCPHAYKFARL